MLSVRQLSNYLFGTYNTIDKIAFFINEEYIFDHYHNIMKSLPNDTFDIILADKFQSPSYIPVVNGLKQNGWNVRFLNDVLFIDKYRCLLTHLYLGGNTLEHGSVISRFLAVFFQISNKIFSKLKIKKSFVVKKQYLQNILGLYNIRFMYGADAGGEKFGEYNNLFDMFFCHGPRDSRIIQEEFKKPVFEMGYPRYDNYFSKQGNTSEKEFLITKYLCDSQKKTILWICTVSTFFSTIETYASTMINLTDKYNVIIRPHPLEIDPQYSRFNPKVLDIVNDKSFILNSNPYQDMTELYLIADFVVCDYGGSIFSALYMDKRIILLNHQDVNKDPGIYTSVSMEIRQYLPTFDTNNVEELKNCLADESYWAEADKNKEAARQYYFGQLRGDSSLRTINYLLNEINTKEFLQ